MGSEFKIVLYTNDDATARRASRAAFDRIAALDAALSDYDPESELMRLCDRAGGPPVARQRRPVRRPRPIAGDLPSDPAAPSTSTIGPVVRLWRRARRTRKMPDPELLAKARALVGSDKVRLDPEARTVQLARSPG